MIGNETKQLIERELGIHPYWSFLKNRKSKPVGKRRVKRGGTSIFFSARNVGR